MGKVVQFSPSHLESKPNFNKAKTLPVNDVHSSQLNIFRHQARIIPIELGKTNFEMALEYDGKDNQIAKAFYERAIQNGENIADSYCNIGILEVERDSFAALNCFLAALMDDPFHFQSAYNLGCLYLDLGQPQSARLYFQKAITIDSTHSPTYYNLSIVLNQLGETDAAQDMLLKYNFIIGGNFHKESTKHIFLTKST